MSNPIIRAENLSKYYRLGVIGAGTLREDVSRWLARLQGKPAPFAKFGEADRDNRNGERIWALRNLDFEVQQGEILGIIGRNGAGKSTLLKILSRITAPSAGRITVRGRVGSLLEVGTGFHPELTGRENIYLNGTILGMTKVEVDRKLEEIVDFAEMTQFVDTPVKRYSSGMTVRLAFAVAAHLEPEILVFDEVLAVGDAAFQDKCLGKMQDLGRSGRTVLFVTHNLGAAQELCTRGMVISHGSCAYEGNMQDAVQHYLQAEQQGRVVIGKHDFKGHLQGEIMVNSISVNGQLLCPGITVNPLEPLEIVVEGESRIALRDFDIFVTLASRGIRVVTLHDSPPGTPMAAGPFRSSITLPARVIRPGTYSLGMGGERAGGYQWFYGSDLCEITVLESWADGYFSRSKGLVNICGTVAGRSQEGR